MSEEQEQQEMNLYRVRSWRGEFLKVDTTIKAKHYCIDANTGVLMFYDSNDHGIASYARGAWHSVIAWQTLLSEEQDHGQENS